jgi:hypothetical protein
VIDTILRAAISCRVVFLAKLCVFGISRVLSSKWAWGMGHGALGIGHGALGIGHGKNPIDVRITFKELV